MPGEELSVPQESLPADVPAPSAEVSQEPQPSPEITAQPVVAPEEQRVPLTRLQEVIRERDLERQRSQQLMEVVQRVQPQAPVQPVNDPWEGLVNHPEPQTAMFYQQQKRLFEYTARQTAEQQNQSLMQVVDAGRRELAQIKISQFRKENPEIKPNSPEEQQIAVLIGQGYDLDTAKKLALYDRQEQELLTLRAKQSSVGAKAAANQTGPTQGMPATAGLPGRPGDWRENVRQAARKGGSLADIVNAAGASRAP